MTCAVYQTLASPPPPMVISDDQLQIPPAPLAAALPPARRHSLFEDAPRVAVQAVPPVAKAPVPSTAPLAPAPVMQATPQFQPQGFHQSSPSKLLLEFRGRFQPYQPRSEYWVFILNVAGVSSSSKKALIDRSSNDAVGSVTVGSKGNKSETTDPGWSENFMVFRST